MATCVPLLECNREQLVGYDYKTGEFIEYFYGERDCSVIGKSYQQLLSWIFVDLGYAGLVDLVQEVATRFADKYIESFLEFMASDDETSAEDAKLAFVASTAD